MLSGLIVNCSAPGLRALAAVLLLLPALPARTATASPYGLEFVRVGRAWPDAMPERLPEHRADTAGAVEESGYRRELEVRQKGTGPYSDALAEPLAGLARRHRDRGEMAEAQRLYRRALHIVRINDGLYTERQIPILRELLDTSRLAGEFDTLDTLYDYYFRLHGAGQPPYTEPRVRASLEYLRWQREALRLELDGEDNRRLLALFELNEELLGGTGGDPEADPAWYRELSLSQLHNLYLVQERIRPRIEVVGAVPGRPMFSNDWNEEDLTEHRLETLQRGALSRGVSLVQALLADEAAREDQALLLRELGDWYQWNGSPQRADEQYRHAIALLRRAGREGELEAWFGQPVELPDNGAFWQSPVPREGQRRIVVEATYDVSERGRPRNIEARTEREEDLGLVSIFRRGLSRTRFRPHYGADGAEGVAGLVRNYEMVD